MSRYSIYKNEIMSQEKAKDFAFNEDGRVYYVYRITSLIDGKHYYGSRIKKKGTIEEDFWKYCTSSTRKKDIKTNKNNYKLKIIKTLQSNTEMMLYESFLHAYFDVKGRDNIFFNKSNQSPFGVGFGSDYSEDDIEKLRERTTKLWQRDGYREKMKAIYKNVWQRDGYREKMKAIRKETMSRPEEIEKRRIGTLKRYEDKEFKEAFDKKMGEVNRSESKCKKASTTMKEKWKEAEYREKMNNRKTTHIAYSMEKNGVVEEYSCWQKISEKFGISGPTITKYAEMGTEIKSTHKASRSLNGYIIRKLSRK